MTHKNKKSCKQCVIEFKCRKIPKIAQKLKSRKQCMIEFKRRELPKIAQKQTLFLNRSQIKVNSYVTINGPRAELLEFQCIDFF